MTFCPKCGSMRVSRYTHHGLSCDDCGYDGRTDEFQNVVNVGDELHQVLGEALRKGQSPC